LTEQSREADAVVRVFVGEEDRVEGACLDAELL
jgi:hypothetical protein